MMMAADGVHAGKNGRLVGDYTFSEASAADARAHYICLVRARCLSLARQDN